MGRRTVCKSRDDRQRDTPPGEAHGRYRSGHRWRLRGGRSLACSQEICRGRAGISTALSHLIGASTRPRHIASPTTTVSSWGRFLTSMPAGAGGYSDIRTRPWVSVRNPSRSASASDTTIPARACSIVRASSTPFGANGRSLKNAPPHRSPSRRSVDSAWWWQLPGSCSRRRKHCMSRVTRPWPRSGRQSGRTARPAPGSRALITLPCWRKRSPPAATTARVSPRCARRWRW